MEQTITGIAVVLDDQTRRALARDVAEILRAEAPARKRWCVRRTSPAHEIPAGHTHRSLADARRRGDLEAALTPKGIVFSDEQLATYEAKRAQRRRAKKAEDDAELTPAKALERAGIVVARGAR